MAAPFQEFWAVHEPQLKALGFPQNLASNLFKALNEEEQNSIQNDFSVKKFNNSRPMLLAKKNLAKSNDVYLINHVWTSDGNTKAYHQLEKSASLAERLAGMFSVPPQTDLESMNNVSDQCNTLMKVCDCSQDAAINALSSHKNDITVAAMTLLDDKSVHENPASTPIEANAANQCSYEEFVAALESSGNLPEQANKVYLQKMYENFLTDAVGNGTTMVYNWLDEGDVITVYVPISSTAKKQAIKSTLSTHSWKLVVEGKELINGQLFATVKSDESFWSIESPGLLCMTLEKVLEVDKPWSELIKNEVTLSSSEILLNAWMRSINDRVYMENIMDAMWKFNQTYSVSSPGTTRKQPVWYVMDEYGSAVTHSNDPNFKCSPFFYIPNSKVYNLLWPIKNISEGDVCTRNFVPQIMSGETLDVCKARLKSFIGKKIYQYIESVAKKKNDIILPKVMSTQTTSLTEGQLKPISVYSSTYKAVSIKDKLSALKISITDDHNQGVDLRLISLQETSVRIDSDVLPSAEMIANKDYLHNYVHYRIGESDWWRQNFILPRDLVDFNQQFEQTDLPQYWIVKPVDKKLLEFAPVVTSQYSRIVRMCEAGSMAVSKYAVDQPSFRHRRFVLSYTVVVTSDSNVYIYIQPFVRLTKEEYEPNALIIEYDSKSTVTESPVENIATQEDDFYDDFKIVMNKLLLPRDVDKGWKFCAEGIHQKVGLLGRKLCEDLCIDGNSDRKTIVVFGVDLLLDDNVEPIIIDLNGISNLPNEECLVDILKLGHGHVSDKFVKVS